MEPAISSHQKKRTGHYDTIIDECIQDYHLFLTNGETLYLVEKSYRRKTTDNQISIVSGFVGSHQRYKMQFSDGQETVRGRESVHQKAWISANG